MGDGLEKLPDDIEALHAALLAARAELAIVRAQQSDDQALIAHLKLQIERLNRDRHGPRSERTARLLDQLELTLEELETSATEDELTAEMAAAKTANGTTTVASFSRKRPSRKPFPDHLPRERVVVPGPMACACCGGARLSKLGEDITETLEVVPKSWKVIQHVREKFSCRDYEKISQAPAPFHVIARGWAGPSFLAMVLFEKFGQHQPLNRQAERYAREGVPVSLSTLADQVGGCTLALMPLFNRLEAHVLAAERLHGDDTTVPVLAKGKTSTGRIWGYVRDDKPFGGQAPPGAVFYYSRDRAGEHPQAHLASYSGIFQADAYGGYGRLYEAGRNAGPILEAACWVHARRPFFVLADLAENARCKAQGGKKPAVISPLALEAVRRIDALFEIERGINGETQERRRAVRQELSAPLVGDLEGWMREQRAKLSRGNDVAKAMDYMLKRWSAFTRFLDDGRICLSNNAAERALRGIALGRKSWLFCGSDRGGDRAALMYSLIVTAKMNDIDPQAWLADVLNRIAEHPAHRLDELLPWNWRDTIRRVDQAA
ncbi:Transposase [Bradyrhizobium shewense]|uniref:Transposase n=1 Tax=Bradyrhizobium shewense TaxID=1761772 RepID=A0A1C3XUU4_9BRAD|nr:IS66 family transposase [Bradyrhizobium shewense]SCB56031.1 Transposase [Bradyrhizobium shewense]